MKYTVGYAFHNRPDLFNEILNGLVFHSLEDCEYIFILDGCKEEHKAYFYTLLQDKQQVFGRLLNFKVIEMPNVFELYSNNKILETFTTDVAIIFQDDMILNDPGFFYYIDHVINIYNKKLGIIGFRDGFEANYSFMYSSEFSGSGGKILKSSEFREVSMLNRGPIVIPRTTYDLLGPLSTEYNKTGSYSDMDYCLQAKLNHNLTNIVMGANVKHLNQPNPMFPVTESENREIFIKKWGKIA